MIAKKVGAYVCQENHITGVTYRDAGTTANMIHCPTCGNEAYYVGLHVPENLILGTWLYPTPYELEIHLKQSLSRVPWQDRYDPKLMDLLRKGAISHLRKGGLVLIWNEYVVLSKLKNSNFKNPLRK